MKMTLAQWQQTLKDPSDFILQASTILESDGWQPFPIGMSYKWVDFPELWNEFQIGDHEQLLLLAVYKGSDSKRRPTPINRASIVKSLELKGFRNLTFDFPKYLRVLKHYKFVVSPEGNGIDCHRTYEALMAGCIPIVEDKPEVRKKFQGCPVLYTKDYKELNTLYLLKQYEKMLNTEYDFSRLLYSSYPQEEQKSIKESCDYWMNKTRPLFPPFYK
jgi:hypothetical protein